MSTATDLDSTPFDPVALLALFEESEGNPASSEPTAPQTSAASTPADVGSPTAAVIDTAIAATVTTAAAEPETAPDGIATKDGKHIIPYSVLQADRQRATVAENEARALREQLVALQSVTNPSVSGVKQGDPATTQQTEAELEELAQLKEDFPTVYNQLMQMQGKLHAQQAQFLPVEERVRHAEQAEQESIAGQIQDAIDATPKLAHIKATNPASFELAKQFDNTLKDNAMWAGKPLAERFAKVVALVEQMTGEIVLPGAVVRGAVAVTPAPASKTPEQTKQAALAIARAAVQANQSAVPTSLSEFPAGDNAVSSEREAIESMSVTQLAQKFALMSPDKLEAYMKNL